MKKIIKIIILSLLICARASAGPEEPVSITITINKPPSIDDFTPVDGHVVSEGDTIQISVTASDPNNDILEYRFTVNGIVKRDWGTSDTYSYVLGPSDVGLNSIKAEVRDTSVTIETGTAEVYVFANVPILP